MPTPLPTIPGAMYGWVQGTCSGRTIKNVFCFQSDDPLTLITRDAAASGEVATALAGNWHMLATDLSAFYTATECVMYPLGHPTLPAFVSSFTASGSTAGDLAPIQTSALVHHQIYRRGKGSQGRTFLGGLAAASITADGLSLTTTTRNNLQTDFGTMMATVVAHLNTLSYGNWVHAQLSKKGSGATYEVVTSNVELALATQRRRVR